ncbi:MAG: HEAT repeat domain-containing protein [Myxococcaceae bacterium]|nr:HEAT repeat domain-containing protein [Myxococcaceae bacterium]
MHRLLVLTLLGLSAVALAGAPVKGKGGAAKDAAKYIQVFREKDLDAMDGAIASLAALGPAVVPELVKALGDPLPMVRSQVAAVATKLGPAAKACVPALTKGVTDADADVRWNSANALGAIGKASAPALSALETMTKDPLPPLADAARDAIAKIKAAQ